MIHRADVDVITADPVHFANKRAIASTPDLPQPLRLCRRPRVRRAVWFRRCHPFLHEALRIRDLERVTYRRGHAIPYGSTPSGIVLVVVIEVCEHPRTSLCCVGATGKDEANLVPAISIVSTRVDRNWRLSSARWCMRYPPGGLTPSSVSASSSPVWIATVSAGPFISGGRGSHRDAFVRGLRGAVCGLSGMTLARTVSRLDRSRRRAPTPCRSARPRPSLTA